MSHQEDRARFVNIHEHLECSFGHLCEALTARCSTVPRGQYLPGTLGLQSVDVLPLPVAQVSFSEPLMGLQWQFDSGGLQTPLTGLHCALEIRGPCSPKGLFIQQSMDTRARFGGLLATQGGECHILMSGEHSGLVGFAFSVAEKDPGAHLFCRWGRRVVLGADFLGPVLALTHALGAGHVDVAQS